MIGWRPVLPGPFSRGKSLDDGAAAVVCSSLELEGDEPAALEGFWVDRSSRQTHTNVPFLSTVERISYDSCIALQQGGSGAKPSSKAYRRREIDLALILTTYLTYLFGLLVAICNLSHSVPIGE